MGEEMKERPEPEGEANAAACEMTNGSFAAWVRRTEWRMRRKRGFSDRLEGVGGRVVVVPIESVGLTGIVGRRVRMWLFGTLVSGKMYCLFDVLAGEGILRLYGWERGEGLYDVQVSF